MEKVVADPDLMDKFEIPPILREAVRVSWVQRKPDLLGRFDLFYDGNEPPKMLEYNGDTPTLLLESAKAQADWSSNTYCYLLHKRVLSTAHARADTHAGNTHSKRKH